jgi:hypothetical protein
VQQSPWKDLPQDIQNVVFDHLPLYRLLRVAHLSKEVYRTLRIRYQPARERVTAISHTCWGEHFISAVGFVILQFLSAVDLLTGRTDVEFPFLHISGEGRLSLDEPTALGLRALVFISKAPPGFEETPRLHINICQTRQLVASITIGRLPAKVVVVVRGEPGLLHPALSAAISASRKGHAGVCAGGRVQLDVHEEPLGCMGIPLQDDVVVASHLLSEGFVGGSILLLPRVREARKLMHLRFTRKCGGLAGRESRERERERCYFCRASRG